LDSRPCGPHAEEYSLASDENRTTIFRSSDQ